MAVKLSSACSFTFVFPIGASTGATFTSLTVTVIVSDALNAAGFKAVVGNNTSGTVTTTEIDYPASMASQAKTLAAQVPGAALVQTSLVSTVTLKLGTDGLQVKGLGGSTPNTSSSAASSSAANVTVGTGVANVPNQPGCIN